MSYKLSQIKPGKIYHFYNIAEPLNGNKFLLDSRIVIYVKEKFIKNNVDIFKVDTISFLLFPDHCLRTVKDQEISFEDLALRYGCMEKISKKTWYLLIRYVSTADLFREHYYNKALEELL